MNKRALPSKEASLFRELLTFYETRQLKKGLKTADSILKKFPEHGETLCMKGLVLTHMGRREEGVGLVKQGMRLDLTSHICWHVFGLIQKGEKNYEEALKSYTQALRFDKDNMNILRDAAHLQTQLRVFDGLVETRHAILRLRPNYRQHWIALAIAYHLNGNVKEAVRVLEQYEATLKNIPDYDVEHSETLLYHIRVLEDLGEYNEALLMLNAGAKSHTIVDRAAVMEYRARLLTKLQSPDAESAWRTLIDLNPDCYDYFKGYLSQKGLSLDDTQAQEEALQVLTTLSTEIPRANAPRRLALALATDASTFESLVKPYILNALQKGIPSLFSDLKSLYSQSSPTKQTVIQNIIESVLADKDTDPAVHLWALYYLAQHHSSLGNHEKGLEAIDQAIEHTPTLPDLLMVKGRILKRCGDYFGAAKCVNEARLLDGQDRFLNTKTGKYLLRAGCIEEANGILGLFTKKDAPSPGADLEDMQSFLYILEEANAHKINNKLHMALKKYMAAVKVVNDFEDDQYDFHGYNLRKFTVNIYLNLLSWEDRLRLENVYVKAALAASQIFIAVHDNPALATSVTNPQLTDAEKKAKKKAKKAAQKAEEKKTQNQAANEDKGLDAPTKDDDPDGSKLLASPDGLEHAAKLLRPLTTSLIKYKNQDGINKGGIGMSVEEEIEVWVTSYDVAIRRRKLLQAITYLSHAKSLSTSHPSIHKRLIHLRYFTSQILQQTPPSPSGPIFIEKVDELIPKEEVVNLTVYNSEYLQKFGGLKEWKGRGILGCVEILVETLSGGNEGLQKDEVEGLIFGLVRDEEEFDVSIQVAQKALNILKSINSDRVEEFRERCKKKFNRSTCFGTEEELKKVKESVFAPTVLDGSLSAVGDEEEKVIGNGSGET